MKKFITPTTIIIAAVVIAVAALVYGFALYPKAQLKGTVTAAPMNLEEDVAVDGTVVPAENIALSFERGGRVVSLAGDVGTAVSKGEVIASVNSASLEAQLEGAQAALQTEQLKLNNLQSQSNPNAAGSSVQVSISNAKTSFLTTLSSAYVGVDGTLATYIDQLFTSPRTDPVYGVTITENSTSYSISAPQAMENTIDADRNNVNSLMASWNTLNATAQATQTDEDITSAEQAGEKAISAVQTLLTDITTALGSYTGQDATSQALYNSYKSAVNTARTTLNATLASLQAGEQTYASSKTSVSPYDVSLQQASINSAASNVDAIKTQIAEGSIISPIDGIITEEDVKVGETASDNTPVIYVMSQGNFQIDAYVSEADINKVQVGQNASVTLSVQGQGQVASTTPFSASVVSIDPAETMQNGIGSYKVTLQFNEQDPAIKSGMTAHVSIVVAQKSNVLAVPDSSIITKDNNDYVLLSTGNSSQFAQQQVTTGIEGNGYTEIVSGLSEGDKVAAFGNQ